MKNKNIAIIVLAAGASTRLGQAKQCVKYNGDSLIVRQCSLASQVVEHVFCVLGFQATLISAQISQDLLRQVNIVTNDNWHEGMSSSISAGITAIIKNTHAQDFEGVMIVLVDQWQLQEEDLVILLEEWQRDPDHIVLASSDMMNKKETKQLSSIGPPVIFPKSFFNELLGLTGEQGAKPLLKKHSHRIKKIPLAHAFVDLDTPEQLLVLKSKQAHN